VSRETRRRRKGSDCCFCTLFDGRADDSRESMHARNVFEEKKARNDDSICCVCDVFFLLFKKTVCAMLHMPSCLARGSFRATHTGTLSHDVNDSFSITERERFTTTCKILSLFLARSLVLLCICIDSFNNLFSPSHLDVRFLDLLFSLGDFVIAIRSGGLFFSSGCEMASGQ
jgi:hypothetical protein